VTASPTSRLVLHVDLDEFIAAVEILRRPELAGRPVVVGGDGDPTRRGVVSTANYEARRFGVHSAMPLRTAYRMCPQAVFLPVDAEAYEVASREVMATLRTFDAVIEVAGWDEAFLETEADQPQDLARAIQRAVLASTALWCSIGVGDNKLRAKLASGLAKPRGVFELTRANWDEVMGGQPTSELWGIGAKTARRLDALGIRRVEQLGAADEDGLARAFGPRTGPWLRRLASGEDASPVSAEPRVPKSRGRERTFQEDLASPDRIRAETARLARELEEDLAGDGREIARVVVKVRLAPFLTTTRGVTFEGSLEASARAALERVRSERPVRLLGVRAEFAKGDDAA
jgi:nucleotidyltransferase/DNA polymerase involved in DNA repair